MKEKKIQWHIILLVVLIMLFSLLCWLKFSKSIVSSILSKTKEVEISETAGVDDSESSVQKTKDANQTNRLMRRFNQVEHMIDAADNRWHNNMFKKTILCKFDSIFTYCTTSEIASTQVLKGADDWLFYKSATDGDTIADYEGTNLYSPEDLNEILNATLSMQNEAEKRGIQIAFLIPPNKENLYSQYMPDNYKQSPVSRTGELAHMLRENGVNIIFSKDVLQQNIDDYRLYYSGDTHWNQLGAYVGIQEVLGSWEIDLPPLESQSITSYPKKPNDMDLVRMTGLQAFFHGEQEYEVSIGKNENAIQPAEDPENHRLTHYKNPDAMIDASLLLIGDSFRTSMAPVLSQIFSDFHVIHRTYYTNDVLDKTNPDYLIIEIVERYSDLLRQFSPFA